VGANQPYFCALLDFRNYCNFFPFGEDHGCSAYGFVDIVESQSAVDPTRNFVAQTVENVSQRELKILLRVEKRKDVISSYLTLLQGLQKSIFSNLLSKDWA